MKITATDKNQTILGLKYNLQDSMVLQGFHKNQTILGLKFFNKCVDVAFCIDKNQTILGLKSIKLQKITQHNHIKIRLY